MWWRQSRAVGHGGESSAAPIERGNSERTPPLPHYGCRRPSLLFLRPVFVSGAHEHAPTVASLGLGIAFCDYRLTFSCFDPMVVMTTLLPRHAYSGPGPPLRPSKPTTTRSQPGRQALRIESSDSRSSTTKHHVHDKECSYDPCKVAVRPRLASLCLYVWKPATWAELLPIWRGSMYAAVRHRPASG